MRKLCVVMLMVLGTFAVSPMTVWSADPAPATKAVAKTVSLNRSSAKQLQSLAGIGPVTAQRIVEYREANGPFKKIEDLLKVKGIGRATFEKIRDKLVLN